MSKTAALIVFFACFCQLLQAQHPGHREVLRLPVEAGSASLSIAVPLVEAAPFLSFFAVWQEASAQPEARFSVDGQRWGDWQPLVRDVHNPDKIISEQIFADAAVRFFQLRLSNPNAGAQELECHFYNPGISENIDPQPEGLIESRACPCVQPAYLTRNQWCPAGNCPPNPSPSGTVVKHLIVHHSAGSNTAADWAAVVRSIWDFHVNGNGWSDIGYNWLIDPNGQVYEGRGDNILGAHFCGVNGGTMGVCMLGTFTSVTPASNAVSSLQSLLAWKSCDADILPLDSAFHASSGLVLDRISGHRDGCATECPGTTLYAMLPSIRNNVSAYITNDCAALTAPTQLEAAAAGDTEIELTWTDNAGNETAFVIERSAGNNADFSYLASVGANVTNYTDTGLSPFSLYYYRIRATVGQDTSDYSNEASATTLVSGVDEMINESTVAIAPNPAHAHVTFTLQNPLEGEVEITMLDAGMRPVISPKRINKTGGVLKHTFPVDELNPGLYFIQLRMAGHTGLFKVLIQP